MGVVRRKASAKYETREGVQYIPDSLAPSGFREYCVTTASWNRRREALAERAKGRCEECRVLCPFPYGDGAHTKSTGSGGDESLDNLRWLCRNCHRRSHQPKAVPRKR